MLAPGKKSLNIVEMVPKTQKMASVSHTEYGQVGTKGKLFRGEVFFLPPEYN